MHKYNIGEYLYNILPPIYRKADLDTNMTLKKYLDALGISVGNVLDDTVNLLELIDVEKIPTRLLPYYGRMFGFEYDDSVPEDFQRKYLANIVDIFKRKGTKAVIRFTARELTGMDATVTEGHYLGFKTWGTNPHDEKCGEYVQPRTYGGKTKTPFYYLGGDNTSRYTIIVSLSADEGKDSDEIFLNTQLISRYTKELVQPYVNLRYRATGIMDSDTYDLDRLAISEWHRDSSLDSYKRKGNIRDYDEFIQAREKFAYSHKHRNEEEMLDNVKLLTVPHMIVEEREVEEQEGMIYILDKTELSMTLDVTDEESWLMTTKDTERVANTSVKSSDKFRIGDEDTVDNLETTYEDLGVTANRTVAYNEVLTLKSSYSKDAIHLNTDYDIITLGTVTDEHEDKIISNYEFLGQQYALKHEGKPKGLKETKYNVAPCIENAQPPTNNEAVPISGETKSITQYHTYAYWVTTYLEEGLGEVDDNIGIELANAKIWIYNPVRDIWTVSYEGFESIGWRKEQLIYSDSKSSISGTYKSTGSTNIGEATGYILRHRGTTEGYASISYAHQNTFPQNNQNIYYYIAQVDFRLTKYDSSGYDNLDDAHILVNISNSWRAYEDGICEHNWDEDKVASFGRYLRATRDWRTAYTTNLPQNWEGSIPSELQPTKEKGE